MDEDNERREAFRRAADRYEAAISQRLEGLTASEVVDLAMEALDRLTPQMRLDAVQETFMRNPDERPDAISMLQRDEREDVDEDEDDD